MRKTEEHKINWDAVCGLCLSDVKRSTGEGEKIRKLFILMQFFPTLSMKQEKMMKMEIKKGYDFDPVWSAFNPAIRDQIQARFKKAAKVFFFCVYLFIIFLNSFLILLYSFLKSARPSHEGTVYVFCCICSM